MARVKLTVVESKCREGYFKTGDCYIVEDLCPPICHEFWHAMYPYVYTILNGGLLDYGGKKAPMFDMKCPDGDRVIIHGEIMNDEGSMVN